MDAEYLRVVFHYRLFDVDGESICEIDLPDPVTVGDDVIAGRGRRLRVVSVVFATSPESRFDALVMVAPAETSHPL